MITTIEELSLNAWPALQQLLYDGWLLRFAKGYTKRANSVNVIYRSTQPVQSKIERCNQIYHAKNLTPVFRITPLAQADQLDKRLAQLGFEKRSPTSVQLLDLASFQTQATPSFKFWSEYSAEWESYFIYLHGAPPQRATHQAILRNIVPHQCFGALFQGNQVVACGLGVLENHYIGLFDVVTAEPERRQGFGQSLVANILHWAKKHGATTAYLQVEVNNRPALSLYGKLGFRESYQYWYRVK